MPTLHTIVPCYNEPATLGSVIDSIMAAPLPRGWTRHTIIVDDASDAQGIELARGAATRHDPAVTLIEHPVNRGKGAAIRTAFDHVLERDPSMEGAVIVHDADLEYSPIDHAALVAALGHPVAASARPDAVFGNRFHAGYRPGSLKRRMHRLGNRMLTACSNWTTGYSLHDMECCLKCMPIRTLAAIRPLLTEDRFGIEPQWTAALARTHATIAQVEITYCARGFAQGKKIGVRDALQALRVMWRDRPKHRAGR